ncbi:GNAT family protein [Mesorhizobium sp. B2-7-2]|uniref:GNAT family N-acetyltransferase n=1 Tax=Mesorhizobium sp. B2-7-2 TaxID=2589908 RepID=UPI0011281FDE|nr:GNAT family protein [Mesorhizobium sp. B2-7-2]TPJ28978.1 GNAT family N-acetyltransferase [Mesorhizobium sp. B2-7-2]
MEVQLVGEGHDDNAAVSIVPMTLAHIESFHRALDVVARERRYLSMLEAPPFEQTLQFAKGRIEKGDPGFVAVVGEKVVGWCDITRHDMPAHAHRGTLGMGILPIYRGRGLGLKLINAALARARSAGMVRVELSVHADNARAIALYDKVGFVREGVVRDAVRVDGEYRDAIMMAIIDRENAIKPDE